MGENKNNILELNFSGNDINPNAVKPSEIASQIVNFEEALLYVIKENNPEIDTNQILFSFTNIGNNSLDIFFKPILAVSIVLASYGQISESINNDDYTSLPVESVQSLNKILKFTRKYDCIASFKLNDEVKSSISKETIINKTTSAVYKGNTILYGKLTDIGGERPNLHLKINEEDKIIIDISEEVARDLAPKLYQYIGLQGLAVWDANTFKVKEFKFSSIVPYKGGNTLNAINEIKNNISTGVWDKYNSDDEIIEALFRK